MLLPWNILRFLFPFFFFYCRADWIDVEGPVCVLSWYQTDTEGSLSFTSCLTVTQQNGIVIAMAMACEEDYQQHLTGNIRLLLVYCRVITQMQSYKCTISRFSFPTTQFQKCIGPFLL